MASLEIARVVVEGTRRKKDKKEMDALQDRVRELEAMRAQNPASSAAAATPGPVNSFGAPGFVPGTPQYGYASPNVPQYQYQQNAAYVPVQPQSSCRRCERHNRECHHRIRR